MSYYKYQNIKSVSEYEIEYQKIRAELDAKREENRVVGIPIFSNCLFDIERLSDEIGQFQDHLSGEEVYQDQLKSNLEYYISKSKASYLAPAYNCNNYLDFMLKYNINVQNRDYNEIPKYNRHLGTIHVQNIFISIKCLLDRLVAILSFYFSGFSIDTTFGRIKDTKNASGLMSSVIKMKDVHGYMNFVYDEYHDWIKEIVEPRDTIIHYNDMDIRIHYTADGREFFLHTYTKIFDKEFSELHLYEPSPDEGHYYKSLMKSVQKVYKFFDITFEVLKQMEIKYKKSHFIKESDFVIYKNNGYKF